MTSFIATSNSSDPYDGASNNTPAATSASMRSVPATAVVIPTSIEHVFDTRNPQREQPATFARRFDANRNSGAARPASGETTTIWGH